MLRSGQRGRDSVCRMAGGVDGCKYDGPMANYRDYTDRNAPGWCVPLAALLFKFGDAPFIYVACAFGWLTRGLIEMGAAAYCIDWSPWTTRRAGHDLWPLPNCWRKVQEERAVARKVLGK